MIAKCLFTDLDGTLLDHASYQPGPAAAALDRLLAAGVAVFFCSAKTRVEQQAIADELSVEVGMIVENGAAVYGADGAVTRFGIAYEEVRTALHEAAVEAGAEVRGYGDMETAEVMRLTGLDEQRAEWARTREFTESFVLDHGDPVTLRKSMSARGLRMQRGSRFWTAQGNHNKGLAVRWIMQQYHTPVESYAIGDYDNDLEMLAAVDTPMVVQQPDGSWRHIPVPDLVFLDAIGPAGWVLGADRVVNGRSSR